MEIKVFLQTLRKGLLQQSTSLPFHATCTTREKNAILNLTPASFQSSSMRELAGGFAVKPAQGQSMAPCSNYQVIDAVLYCLNKWASSCKPYFALFSLMSVTWNRPVAHGHLSVTATMLATPALWLSRCYCFHNLHGVSVDRPGATAITLIILLP